MNNIVLMGEIVTRPELRETQDGLARTNFLVNFSPSRTDEADYQVAVVVFGNSASEVSEQFVPGDQVVVEGRLQMNTVSKQDGSREKRAEIVARRLHPVGGKADSGFTVPAAPAAAAPMTIPVPPRASKPAATLSKPPLRTESPASQNENLPF